ncbi:hypothetical protein LCGC14_0746250 [marine sediment metagenome]|uniref:HTH cro/C1-type domain-containing protein n=1 Tax=marine sediment metagenome TaxID=412755 RepID=A0A0F9Q597_9ZZZZ
MTDGIRGFNKRLRKARKAYELKYDCDLDLDVIAARVAEVSGVKKRDTTTIGRWLKKSARPRTWEEAQALAEVLEVWAGWLVFGEGEMGRGISDIQAAGDISA